MSAPRESPELEQGKAAVFRRLDAEHWLISYEGDDFVLSDAKGLYYLSRLLPHPGQEVAAVEFANGSAKAKDSVERARSAVTKRIRDAIGKIASRHAALGYHLRTAIRTGANCVYEPDPARPVHWSTESR